MSDRNALDKPDRVLHACPECSIGNTNPHCPLCRGAGTLPEKALLGMMAPGEAIRHRLGL